MMRLTLVSLAILLLQVMAESAFHGWMKSRDMGHADIVFRDGFEQSDGHIGSVRIFATKDIKAGEVLYSFDLARNSAAISAKEARRDPDIGHIFQMITAPKGKTKKLTLNEGEITKLYIMWLRANKPQKWAAYLDILPPKFETPLLWTEEELSELEGSPLHEMTTDLKEAMVADWEGRFQKIMRKYPTEFPPEKYKYEDLLYVTSLIGGRVWNDQKIGTVILPLAEVFAFNVETNSRLVAENSMVALVSTKDIPKDTEVVTRYERSAMGNRELLDYYGFVVEENENDNVRLGVTLEKQDKLLGAKLKMFKDKKLQNGQMYKLTQNGATPELIFALRIYHSTVYDFDSAKQAMEDKPISHQNEIAVAKSILDLCEFMLQNYKTDVKDDSDKLERRDALTDRNWMAIKVRRSEKMILKNTMLQAKKVIEDTNTQWSSRAVDMPTALKTINKMTASE